MSVVVYAPGLSVEVIDVGQPADTAPPETTIVSGPTDGTSTSATITFYGTDAEGTVTFEGRLDSESFQPVVSPIVLSNLPVGPHTYEVRAVDAAGNVDGTPAGVTWSVLPATEPVALTLVRRSPSSPQVEYGGYNFQFNKAAIMAGGKIHHVWNGTWEFDLVTFAARKLTVTNSDGTTPTTRPENADMVYVPTESVVYVGNGAPVGPSHSFDPATNVKTMTGWALDGDTLLVFDAPRNRILSIGGYTPPMKVRAFDLSTRQWSWIATTNNPVISPADTAARLSLYRGGISSQGRVGFFAEGNELSELDGGATDWISRPTTGTKPPQYTHFVYYEPLDSYFGWCCANAVAGARTPVVQKFYRLPRSTLAWEELNVAMPSPPVGSSLAGGILLADPERQQLVVMNAFGYVELFTLDLRWLP